MVAGSMAMTGSFSSTFLIASRKIGLMILDLCPRASSRRQYDFLMKGILSSRLVHRDLQPLCANPKIRPLSAPGD